MIDNLKKKIQILFETNIIIDILVRKTDILLKSISFIVKNFSTGIFFSQDKISYITKGKTYLIRLLANNWVAKAPIGGLNFGVPGTFTKIHIAFKLQCKEAYRQTEINQQHCSINNGRRWINIQINIKVCTLSTQKPT